MLKIDLCVSLSETSYSTPWAQFCRKMWRGQLGVKPI